MSRVLDGVSGASPLGFMSALGALRVLHRIRSEARLSFLDDGSFRACVHGVDDLDLAEVVARDAESAAGPQAWRLEYDKEEKNGTKRVADLKAPPEAFRRFVEECLAAAERGDLDPIGYAAAFATDVAVDGKGNTKPTAFHFTAANQTFLGGIEQIRASVTQEWAELALAGGSANRKGSNMRWDPDAERNRALMGSNPVELGTSVNAPFEWLAFRSLPLFPTVPRGTRIATTGVDGRRQDDMSMRWPLWSYPAAPRTVASLLGVVWQKGPREAALRGIFATCTSAIRRTGQGFGNFGPAAVSS